MVYWSCDYFGRCFAAVLCRWRMLGRPFYCSGGCFAALLLCRADALLLLAPADAWPLWLCYSLVVFGGYFAVVVVLLFGRLRRMLCRCGCAALWSSPTVASLSRWCSWVDALPPFFAGLSRSADLVLSSFE
jgi:hypothetical protein